MTTPQAYIPNQIPQHGFVGDQVPVQVTDDEFQCYL